MNPKEEISKKEKQDRNTVVMCIAVSMGYYYKLCK